MSLLTPPLSKRGILKALGQDPSKSDVLTVSTNPDGLVIIAGDQDVTNQIRGGGSGAASAWEEAAQYVAVKRDTSGLKLAILGDSILASPGTYAQITNINGSNTSTAVPWVSVAMLELAAQSPGWIPAQASWSATYVQAAWGATNGTFPLGYFPVPNLQTKKSVDPTITLPVYTMPGLELCKKVTIYHLARTNANAPIFRVTINGTQQVTIDTYEPAVNFGAVLTNQSVTGIVKATTITLTTPSRTVALVFDQMTLVDRGSGVGSDGTQAIFGIDVGGSGVDHRNFAVGSTTLLESSAANISRGVSTIERVAIAKSYGANAFLIGWGTNDSKTGVSTPDAYAAQLNALLDDLDASTPASPKILFAPPKGAAGSVYENNQIFADKMRGIAQTRGLPLLDAKIVFDAIGPGAYLDEVHPSPTCRVALSRELVRLLGGRVTQRAA